MDTESLRNKSNEELQEELVKQLQEQFTMKLQLSVRALKETHLLSENRRQIARIKTLMAEKDKAEKDTKVNANG